MSAYEAVRIRLDPTPRQTRLLESHAGGARFAYNLMLAHVQRQISLGEKPDWTLYAMRRWWNEWKDEIAPWWRENSKEAYSSAFEWLSQALRNWSDSRKGRRAGRRVGWPKYKSKRSSVPRFAYTTGSFGLIEDDPKALKLPRIGRVHCMENATERVHGRRIVRMTVSRHAGFWYAALTVERPTESVPAKNRKRKNRNRQVGVDLGVKTLATLSDGTTFPNPRNYVRTQRKLRHAQQSLSRRDRGMNHGCGSKRYNRALERVRRIHARIAAQRADNISKLTTWLADNYSDISIEDLNVQGMSHNRRLAKHILDADFHEFRVRIITLTADEYLDKAKDKRKQWDDLCDGADTPMPDSPAAVVSDMEGKAARLRTLLNPDDPPLLDGRDIAILKELKPYGVVKPAEESQRLRDLGVLERRYYIDQVFDALTDKGEKALEFASHVGGSMPSCLTYEDWDDSSKDNHPQVGDYGVAVRENAYDQEEIPFHIEREEHTGLPVAVLNTQLYAKPEDDIEDGQYVSLFQLYLDGFELSRTGRKTDEDE